MDQPLDGPAFHEALGVAERWLAANRDAINAINVYPVPDGDTGTNMLLTLRAARAACLDAKQAPPAAVEAYATALSRGALLGARGNSGVILSQMVRGFAEALEGCVALGPKELARALDRASNCAYESVGDPVEGTMLTVLRDAAAAATSATAALASTPGGRRDLASTLEAATREAEASVARTPSLLATLRDAGVVDAGGQGIAVLLAGLGYAVRGEPLPELTTLTAAAVNLDGVEHEGHGYCVQYVVLAAADRAGVDRDALVGALEKAGGDSILAVGDPSALRVHVHAADPGLPLSAGAARGTLEAISVENMQAQHEAWSASLEDGAAAEASTAAAPAVGLLAVVQGEGLAQTFRELGASVLDGGPSANPSVGELLEAARSAGRDHVLVLPNDPNVLRTAERAAEEDLRLRVVPTTSAVTGLAAAVAYLPDDDLDGDPDIEAIAAELVAAARLVRSIAVTRAVRRANVDGIEVEAGEAMALVDGRLVACASGIEPEALDRALLEALSGAVDAAQTGGGWPSLVTIYLGADADADAAIRLGGAIADAYPELECECVAGGQPHYPYLAGLE